MHARRRVASALAALVALPLAGCTLIGLGIGAMVDNNSAGKAKSVSPLSVATASPGQSVQLQLRGGQLVTGERGAWRRPCRSIR